jgi:hypothetical protein
VLSAFGDGGFNGVAYCERRAQNSARPKRQLLHDLQWQNRLSYLSKGLNMQTQLRAFLPRLHQQQSAWTDCRLFWRLIAVAACFAAARPALANDSTAELATGGLIFVQNQDVEMRSEDLFISADQIRIRYVFVNISNKDATVLVAFPLPPVTVNQEAQNIPIRTQDPANFVEFKTMVDGQPVKTQVEQRAFALGLDRTQYLRALGIPLAPHLRSTNDTLDRLPPNKWNELVTLGLAAIETYGSGEVKPHLAPRWTLQTTFYWQQTFKAGRETVIQHNYAPTTGGSVATALGGPQPARDALTANYASKYCLDREFFAALERARKSAKSEVAPYSELRIDYILKTGANWSGPIKNFRLVVDKGDADSLVSFCGDHIKKISPTQFEMRQSDFIPAGDLVVLILKKQ